MAEFVPLASGSRGNAILIRGNDGTILVDAGLERQDLVARLRRVGQPPAEIDALLLTHRHRDHARAAATMSRRFKIPVHATAATVEHQGPRLYHRYVQIHCGLAFDVAGFGVTPVRLSHDAPETLAFLIEAGCGRIGIATDLGCSGGALTRVFRRLDLFYLEFNYDCEMLLAGDYEWPLKKRIMGAKGHLSNDQAAALLGQVADRRLRVVYLAHLSASNNRRDRAIDAARRVLRARGLDHVETRIALQDDVSQAYTIGQPPRRP